MSIGTADSIWPQRVKTRGLESFWGHLRIAIDAEQGRFFLWSPVFVICGIWIYFARGSEPNLALTVLASAVGGLCFWFGRQSVAALSIAALACGFVLAKLRTEWVATPLVTAYTTPVQIEGLIDDVDPAGGKRSTLTVTIRSALGILDSQRPTRVRLSVNQPASKLHVGQSFKATATLLPLPWPVMPGGFDRARQLYFQSIGGTGFSTDFKIDESQAIPLSYWPRHLFRSIRSVIGEKIHAAIPGPLGSIADAMITGERANIPEQMNQSLQRSGLFHILSISGLHMTIVAGGAFWIVRALLALSPFLALNFPIKKIAACFAMVTGAAYMLLADSGPATERSYIMIAVMFFAVLVDRRAISLHNLAVAALIILVTSPEQALSASFQMSFMAVMGIAGLFEWWGSKANNETPLRSRWTRYALNGGRMTVASVATSLAAGGLSAIPAVYHFGRLAPFGVIANALALPLISVVIMPMALLGTLASIFGLEQWPFEILGQGLAWLMHISDWVSGWQAAGQQLPQPSILTVLLLIIGAVIFCLSGSRLRWIAVPAFASIFLLPGGADKPDVLIDARMQNIAVRGDDARLVQALPRKSRYTIQRWLMADGDDTPPAVAAKRPGWSCIETHCTAQTNGQTVVFLLREAEGKGICPRSDILIAVFPLRHACAGAKLTIDRFDVWKSGSIALHIDGGTITETTAAQILGHRPWVVVPTPRRK